MTVEAAFIIPIIIFTLVAIFHLIFFLFNTVKAESDIDRLLFGAERQIENILEYQRQNGQGIVKKMEGYLDASKAVGAIYAKDDEIAVEINVKTSLAKIPFISLLPFGKIDKIRHLKLVNSSERGRQIVAVYETLDVAKRVFDVKNNR